MKWTLKLIMEFDSGETGMHEVAGSERPEAFIKPASLGMSIKESKLIAASIQAQMVSDQVDRHNKALMACRVCGQRVRKEGYYKSIFKSVFGKVPMRVRRVWGCECRGAEKRTFSSLPTGRNPTASELSYLTSKLAALIPFGKVADFLGELLPTSAKTNANSVRNRVMRVGRRLENAAAKGGVAATRNSAARSRRGAGRRIRARPKRAGAQLRSRGREGAGERDGNTLCLCARRRRVGESAGSAGHDSSRVRGGIPGHGAVGRRCRIASDTKGGCAEVGAHFGLVSLGDALSARDPRGPRPEPRSDPDPCETVGDGKGGSSKVVSVEWQIRERPSLLAVSAKLADPRSSAWRPRTYAPEHGAAGSTAGSECESRLLAELRQALSS